MSRIVSTCWRGPPGSGKRMLLQENLREWATQMGQLYVPKTTIMECTYPRR